MRTKTRTRTRTRTRTMRAGQANKIASKLGNWKEALGGRTGTHLTSDFSAQVQANLINRGIFSRLYANQVANSIANFSLYLPQLDGPQLRRFPSTSRFLVFHFSRFKCCAHLRPTCSPLSVHKSNYNYEMISVGADRIEKNFCRALKCFPRDGNWGKRELSAG